jgi:hypothetical protein
MLTFSSVVYDGASRGPLWGIHPTSGVVEAVTKAYSETKSLSIALSPAGWTHALFASVVLAVSRMLGLDEALVAQQQRTRRSLEARLRVGFATVVALPAAQSLLPLLGRHRSAAREGRFKRVHEGIERAVAAIQKELGEDMPASWQEVDRVAPMPGMTVLPEQSKRTALARIALWLGIQA